MDSSRPENQESTARCRSSHRKRTLCWGNSAAGPWRTWVRNCCIGASARPGLPEPIFQVLLLKHRDGVRSVPARLIAVRNHDGLATRDSLDFPFKNTEFRRVDQVV